MDYHWLINHWNDQHEGWEVGGGLGIRLLLEALVMETPVCLKLKQVYTKEKKNCTHKKKIKL